jgi:hypothetical protein
MLENENKRDNLEGPGKNGRITKTLKNRMEGVTRLVFKYQNTRVPGGMCSNVVKLSGV